MALILTPIGRFGGRCDSVPFSDNGGYDGLVAHANYLASTHSYSSLNCNKTIKELEEGCHYEHLSDEAIRLLENGSLF